MYSEKALTESEKIVKLKDEGEKLFGPHFAGCNKMYQYALDKYRVMKREALVT